MPSIIVYAVIWKQQLATSPQNFKKEALIEMSLFPLLKYDWQLIKYYMTL